MSGLPVVVPAAGRGTRLRALAPDVPKVLLEVGGRPMIDRALEETAPSPGGAAEHDDVPAFQRLIAAGHLHGIEVEGPLLDLGNAAGYEAARDLG